MQDFCFKTTDQGSLTGALGTLGLVVDGQVAGDWLYVGRVIKTPGVYADDGAETTAPVYHDGEYAVYRATDAQAAVIEAATWPDGVTLVDPPAGVPMFGGEWIVPDLDALKAAKVEEAKIACDAVLAPLGAEYGRWETATWDQQVSEATELMSNPAASVPLLAAMASARDMDVAELAQRILVNREAWSAISGAVIGQRQAIYDRVKAAGKAADVRAITVAISLPTSA